MKARGALPNTKVSITRRVNGKFHPVVLTSNGKIKPDVVLKGGTEVNMPGGNFYLNWYPKGQANAVRQSVGADPTAALNAKRKIENELHILALGGKPAEPVTEPESRGQDLRETIAAYLKETGLLKHVDTYNSYRVNLDYFLEFTSKTTVESIDRDEMLGFQVWLRDEKEMSPHTVYNKFLSVIVFLKWAGYKVPKLSKNDWPKFDEEEPVKFTPEELARFFAACEPDEWLKFQFYLQTGFRMGEVMHFMWRDIVTHPTPAVKVAPKPEYKWKPKASGGQSKGRTVPIQQPLLDALLRAKETSTSPLVFPDADGRPNDNMLRDLKAIAERAGLNPEDFWLHKWRTTYATTCLRNGIDIKTMQKRLGHTSIASTMRYLAAAGLDEDSQRKVEAVVWF
jgi:integrase/recombinase XerD